MVGDPAPLRVLGIDPGTRIVGCAIIEVAGRRQTAVHYGVLRPSPNLPIDRRLGEIVRGLKGLLATWQPAEAGIEEAFHGRDARAALRIGEARGALLGVLAEAGIPVVGYANNVVKQSVTGAGRASKEQVRSMVQRILGLAAPPEPLDASDALAVALCHAQRRSDPASPGAAGAGLPPRLAAALKAAGASPAALKRRRRR